MKWICMIWMACWTGTVTGQEQEVSGQLEYAAEATGEDLRDADQWYQDLGYYRKHPLELNGATQEELQALHLLTDLQIIQFLRYRKLAGKLIDIHELQAVPGFNIETIGRLLPYVTLGTALTLTEELKRRGKGAHSLLMRISGEVGAGKEDSSANRYAGSASHLMFRYRYQYKDLLYFGATGDKDPGEQFFRGAQSGGFDFYSAHLFLRNLSLKNSIFRNFGSIKALAIGDYTVNMGQGLVLWQSMGLGKSADITRIKRSSPALMPYRSAGEYQFNRGLGVTLGTDDLQFTVFASRKKISGNKEAESFTSLQTSGLHRTAEEIKDRNAITLRTLGGHVSYRSGGLDLGLTAIVHRFGLPMRMDDEPYRRFGFSGRAEAHAGLDFGFTYRNLHVFGELAFDGQAHAALISGALISMGSQVDLSFLYRNLKREYVSLFGNAFTENTLPGNEEGWYAGVVIRPSVPWKISAYADLFRFPWLRYRVNAPTEGSEYMLELHYQPDKISEVYFRYRVKNKPLDGAEGVILYPEVNRRQSLRLQIRQEAGRVFAVQCRAEVLWFEGAHRIREQGFLGFTEIESKFTGRIKAVTRIGYFETDGYDSRIYAYESDVASGFSIPAFYNKGLRYYVNMRYEVHRNISLWLRWGWTVPRNRSLVSQEAGGRQDIIIQILMGL